MRSIGKDMDVKVSGITLSYNDEGPAEASVIIFIHGLALNKHMWRKQCDALKNDYRTIAFDIRGHGKTQEGNEDFSMELFADDLIHFMDVLDINKAVICGLSMGGYTALRAMEKYPERFSALVLCDTQCIADTPEGRQKRINTVESIRQSGKEGFALQNAKNIFLPESFTTRKQETDLAIEMAMDMTPDAICNTLLALAARSETCSRLEEINVPTLILVGKEDKLTPPDRSQFMNGKIKNSELHIIDGAAHISNVENADAFNNHLKRFLDNLPK